MNIAIKIEKLGTFVLVHNNKTKPFENTYDLRKEIWTKIVSKERYNNKHKENIRYKKKQGKCKHLQC